MTSDASATRTGGRAATTAVIPGRYALSVGRPPTEPPVGWEWVRLTDIARLETGHTPSRRKPEYWGGNVPWIGIKDATQNDGCILHDTIQHTNPLGIANSSARILPENTVCLSRTASVGYTVVMGRPMATSQDFVNWVCSDAIEWRILLYILLAEKQSLVRFASGTTHQTIYFPEVRAFHVCIPPRAEQRRVVQVLGSLDEKIASNERVSRTLDAVCHGVMERLRFTLATSGPPGTSEATLGEALSVLETGKRPKGGVKGIAWGVPSIGAESIVAAGTFDYAKLKFVPDDYYDKLRRGRLADRDVLLYKDGGRPGQFEPHVAMIGEGFPFDRAAINEHVYRMRVKEPYSQDLLYMWLRSDRLVDEMRRRGTGVAIPGLNSTAVKALPMPPPAAEILSPAQRALAPLVTRILRNARQSKTLADLRDVLIPRLISGELRVPPTSDADEALETVIHEVASTV
jgi:type I restriction enzyme S subunit